MGEQGRGEERREGGEKLAEEKLAAEVAEEKLAEEVAKEDGGQLVWLVWWKLLNACLFLTLILAPWR